MVSRTECDATRAADGAGALSLRVVLGIVTRGSSSRIGVPAAVGRRVLRWSRKGLFRPAMRLRRAWEASWTGALLW